jgi:predicted Zn-dependent peptidase
LLEGVDQANLDTQREVVKEEKRLRYDNVPYGDAFPELMRLVFPGDHPYAHMPIGSMADLDSASLGDVHDFFHQHYRPDNLIITLSGMVGPDEGFALVDQFFSGIPAGGHSPAAGPAGLGPIQDSPRAGLTADVPQDVVYCCWRVPPIADDVHDALSMGLAILAGSMTSRLHQDLVRTGLADSVDAFDLGLAYGDSLIVATAACAEAVSPEHLETAMMESWARLGADGPTPAELARAVKAEERDYLADLASIEDRADHISAAWSLFGDPEEVNRHLGRFRTLDGGDVQAGLNAWLPVDNRAVLTYRSLP